MTSKVRRAPVPSFGVAGHSARPAGSPARSTLRKIRPGQGFTHRPKRIVDKLRTPVVSQLASFAVVGAVSTVVYAGFYLVFRDALGAQLTNLLGSLLCALGSTLANQRLTFRLRSVNRPVVTYVEGITVFCIGLAATSAALFGIEVVGAGGSATWELIAVNVVSVAVGLAKFLVLRSYVFPKRRDKASTPLAA